MSSLTKRTIEERMEEMRKAVLCTCEALEASRRASIAATEAMNATPGFNAEAFTRLRCQSEKKHGCIAAGWHRFTEMAIEHLERTRE